MQNYPTKEVINDIYSKLIEKWQKANALFITPVINDEQCIINKLKKAWEETILVAQSKSSKHAKNKITIRLNKLFDILNCKCVIQLSSKNSCSSNYTEDAHINCSCPKQRKVPKLNYYTFIIKDRKLDH